MLIAFVFPIYYYIPHVQTNRGVRTLTAATAIEFPRRFLKKCCGKPNRAFISCVLSSDSQKLSGAFHTTHPLRVASMHIQCRPETVQCFIGETFRQIVFVCPLSRIEISSSSEAAMIERTRAHIVSCECG